MQNYAVIENGKVVNMCVATSEDTKPDNWVLCEVGGIDWDYIDGAFVSPYVAPIDIDYQAQRAAAYPPMADYIDGIVKGDTAQVQAYIDACLAVKAKYPKPE